MIFIPTCLSRKTGPCRSSLAEDQKSGDFSFICNEVKDTYGRRGNVSVPAPIILKLMLIVVMYNVRSERELMETLPERLDWLWFLGYNLDTPIPDHSVSKARKSWEEETFRSFFERIVIRCSEKGLIDGTKSFMAANFIDESSIGDGECTPGRRRRGCR